MAILVYLVAYTTIDGQTKSATIAPQTTFGRFGVEALDSIKKEVETKTNDRVGFILSFIELGNFADFEIEKFDY